MNLKANCEIELGCGKIVIDVAVGNNDCPMFEIHVSSDETDAKHGRSCGVLGITLGDIKSLHSRIGRLIEMAEME